RPQNQCARPLLQPAAEERVELAETTAPRPPVEALAVLRRDQAREHLHAAGPDDHVVIAAAECLPAILPDPQPPPLGPIVRRQLLNADDAMHHAVNCLV